MTDDLEPYPAYKDSGVEWLGDVPEHWEVRRLKAVVLNVVDQVTQQSSTPGITLALENVESWSGRYADAGQHVILESQLKRFQSGDVLFGKLRPYLAKVACVKESGVCVGEFLVLRAKNDRLSPAFLRQVLCSKSAIDEINASTLGAKMPRAEWGFVGRLEQPLPPLPEQTAIARFLDHVDRRIQRYIRAKEKLITLLEEQKQAIIDAAVTGKIDVRTGRPYPAYKDSGVDWLGEMPAHWRVSRVKVEFQCLNHRRIPLSSTERGEMNLRRYAYYGASGIIDKVDDYLFDDEFLLIAEDGANLVLRSLPLAIIAKGQFWVNNHVHVLKPRKGDLDFLAGSMESLNFLPWISGAAQPKLTQDRLMGIVIAVPSAQEQANVSSFLKKRTSNMRFGIDRAACEVALLREYRSRLIADVVTGKIDVRRAAKDLPEVDPLADVAAPDGSDPVDNEPPVQKGQR